MGLPIKVHILSHKMSFCHFLCELGLPLVLMIFHRAVGRQASEPAPV